MRRDVRRKLEERARMKRLQRNPLWREPLRLAAAFIAMVRREKKGSLGSWLRQEVNGCRDPEICGGHQARRVRRLRRASRSRGTMAKWKDKSIA